MAYKVIQWATGEIGRNAVAGIVGHPDLELVGAWVHSKDKDGRDVGELCGLGPLGVRTTRDKDAILKMSADCVCYAVGRSWMESGKEALVAELAQILRSGKNVVCATWPSLVNPKGIDKVTHDTLQRACLEGGTTFYSTGIDPGFGSIGLALGALTVSSNVRSVHMYEILNYANWDQPQMITFFGFGQPNVDKCFLAKPGYLADIFASTLRLVAEAVGLELDEIVDEFEVIYADEAFDIPSVHIAAGTISGMRFKVNGKVGGKVRLVIDHVTKLRDQDFPEVSCGSGGYRAEVEGEPSVRLDLELSSGHKDNAHAALAASAMTLVNAIPKVCAAAPGVLTYLDLPPHPAKMRG
jgi:4-hydroxy-tetrahydrodipicolinate reductase